MSQPFIGQISMFGGNFAPNGWAFCDGQLLAISQFDALFSLIGTIYGGDGRTTFALPDLRGRLPIHMGQGPGLTNRTIGEQGGSEAVTLSPSDLPAHSHAMSASTGIGANSSPQGAVVASGGGVSVYRPGAPSVPMAGDAIAPAGGNQSHQNMHPYQTINYIIALYGIFPSRS